MFIQEICLDLRLNLKEISFCKTSECPYLFNGFSEQGVVDMLDNSALPVVTCFI